MGEGTLDHPATPSPHPKGHGHLRLPGLGQTAPKEGGRKDTSPSPPPPTRSESLAVWGGSGQALSGHPTGFGTKSGATTPCTATLERLSRWSRLGRGGAGLQTQAGTRHFRDLKGGRLRQEGRQGQPHPLCLFYKGFQDCVGGRLKQRVGSSEPAPTFKGAEGHSSVRSGPHQGGSLLGGVLGDLPIKSQRALSNVGGNFFS